MLGTVDATKRPLKIPPKFVPYMEKHRIYELFYEIARQLIIKKPSDHILYVKQCLRHAARSRDAPRIILICPPDFDKKLLAEYLDLKLGIKAIGLDDVEAFNSSEEFAANVRKILRKLYFEESGWLFIDFPRTKSEARALQSLGIIPTHVIEIIWTDFLSESTSQSTPSHFYSTTSTQSSHDKIPLKTPNDLHNLHDLREAYSAVLIQVETAGRTYEELGRACITLARRRKYPTPCYNFRVVLVGPRGSGRRSVAEYLARRYNLVCIDFDYLVAQARMQNNKVGESLRCLGRWGIRVDSGVKIRIVERKLMSAECLKKGWVLFGYPITVEDFKLLDLLATPPNRIICIDVDEATCRERLFSRRFNVITGSEHNSGRSDEEQSDPNLAVHFKDYEIVVNQNLKEYFANLESLLRYAGESAITVDGTVSERNVKEKVESCLSRAPSAPPRIRKPKEEIKPEDVEFDPDDPTDFKIYDELRRPESILSLV
ncbi:adenylate kinase 8 [Diachasma alloeum]|uniref:adenylate kinase 8 n=1 Tax=Diachasma alloeum TaxID=454923 RepID=UPI0007383FD7|nr:adenylate kinase 8 [Diachasma alloeum]